MTSFVSEILSSAGQMETQEASAKLKQLSKKIDSRKMQLCELTKDKTVNFLPKLNSTELLVDDVETIKSDMDRVSDKIEHQIKGQLNMSTEEFQALTSQLEDVRSTVMALEKLVTLNNGLQDADTAIRLKEYSKAADAILKVHSLLQNKVHHQEDELQILEVIKKEMILKREHLKRELLDIWKETIRWSIPDDQKKDQSTQIKHELRFLVKGEDTSRMEQVVVGMEKMGILTEEMQKFFDSVMCYIIEPVMCGPCVLAESKINQEQVLVITVQSDKEHAHPKPFDLFVNLDKVKQFLTQNFLHLEVQIDKAGNQQISQARDQDVPPSPLLFFFREMVGDKILHLAVKECLIPSIPSNYKDLNAFNDVVNLTEEFNRQWMKAGLISKESTVLVDFVENVNTLFANKKCQEILERARELMTTEIHNTVVVNHEKPLGQLPVLVDAQHEGKKARKSEVLNVTTPLSGNTFRLPPCQISSSIQEVVVIAYETLHEASSSSQQTAIQMFCAVRHMFELFCSVFPTYHKQSLETLPQFTALHYNNCMYIAHHLMTIGHQFSKKLPDSFNVTFVDLVPKIRKLGTEYFLRQLVKQKEQISEYLSAANGFVNVSQKETYLTSERAVKQALHQLQHLKKVWQEVLPPSNYRKALGGLVNNLVVEITDNIVALEDISADDTKQLSRLLNTIIDRVPELFEISEADSKVNAAAEVQRNIAKWQRFKELDLILTASMIDIVDRWAAGKGPLAEAFSANEVKQLIRALFQNTDRRAAVLAKIK